MIGPREWSAVVVKVILWAFDASQVIFDCYILPILH